MDPSSRPSTGFGRNTWLFMLVAVGALLVYSAFTARGGVPDPTDSANLSHGAVILNSALLVLREGLEAILVVAAVTASFRGANRDKRRPVAVGSSLAFAASVATWFIAAWFIGSLGAPGLDIQAATGLLAVIVLLVVMNWFFHRVYWTGWIQHHHKRRRTLLAATGGGVTAGLILLGFTAVYREGFEVVLFLQSLRLKYGAATVLEGVSIGLAFTAIVGVLTFLAHHKLPYKKMLVLTGATIGFVLVVMVGEGVQEMQLAGWLPTTTMGFTLPGWLGTWLAIFPTVETLTAQALAALAVIGSYFLAEHVRVRKPLQRGEAPAIRSDVPVGEPAALLR
ncbi:MAG TPA: FTR1 family protein [Thermoleophilaceae bacterium]|nr:FTR1 family protein [Thermoleophilaceae bacterium]